MRVALLELGIVLRTPTGSAAAGKFGWFQLNRCISDCILHFLVVLQDWKIDASKHQTLCRVGSTFCLTQAKAAP